MIPHDPSVHPLFAEYVRAETRRQFFRRGGNALGSAALAGLMGSAMSSSGSASETKRFGGLPELPHFAAKCTSSITNRRCKNGTTKTCRSRFAMVSD